MTIGQRIAQKRKELGLSQEALGSILAANFPAEVDLSDFSIEFFILLGDGREYPCGAAVEIPAQFGSTYEISLTGSSPDTFRSRRKEVCLSSAAGCSAG